MVFGKAKLHLKFVQHIEKGDVDNEKDITNLLQDIWTNHKLPWLGWIVKGLKDISNKNTKQLFWLTLVLDNKGLSHSGQALASKLNFCLHPKSFQRLMTEQTGLSHSANMQRLHSTPHVWWVDNYNKAYGQRFYKLNNGPQVVLNWTGWGASVAKGFSQQALKKPSRQHPEQLNLVPSELYTMANQNYIGTLIKASTAKTGVLLNTLDKSFCRTHGITNVPLKPTKTGRLVTPKDLTWMEKHNDGLTNFVPMGLIKENIASDVGLAKVLFKLRDFYDGFQGEYFSMGKVDISIFWRLSLVSAPDLKWFSWSIYYGI